ncbi:hypothetical protein [Streptomyces sp. NPDC002133]|uniref:hypothetical protein n=1 Tax=Streptomyces sp. NPDC002133 TaxID=3154409 RepID=UPI0033261BFF
MVELLEGHSHRVLGSGTGTSRFVTGAYGFRRAQINALLSAAGTEGRDALVDVLPAPLAPEVYDRRRTLGLAPEQVIAAPERLARGVLAELPAAGH